MLLVLAATAVPVEMRQAAQATLDFGISPPDFGANIVGYVPVGLVLAAFGPLRALVAAALVSTIAESSQFVMMHRDPSLTDILANSIGAAFGVGISVRCKMGPPELSIHRWVGWIAAITACGIVLGTYIPEVLPVNVRGYSSPGTLEAHWKLDELDGTTAPDSSGHNLDGILHNSPKHVAGVLGSAVALDGATEFIDVDRASALRLAGSMTITGWINSSRFPRDDAAIVSQLDEGAGFQLDTTIDTGPRTIGFKLTDALGNIMARYGATSLELNRWYHVAGVYNATDRTLDVYLDGELDNGYLLGQVSSQQHPSREGVSVGRRRDRQGFEFAGSIDDVRIYSVALTKAEIMSVMRGDNIDVPGGHGTQQKTAERIRMSDNQDKRMPLKAAVAGMLTAFAVLSLLPSAKREVCLFASLFAGLLLLPPVFAYLPLFNLWLIPLVSFVGGASVVLATSRPRCA